MPKDDMRVIHNSTVFKWLKSVGIVPHRFRALTLFEWVLTDLSELPPRMLWHERRHVLQYRWHLYVFFLPLYGLLWIVFGYRDHPYERDARRYADRRLIA